jgi:ABC-type transport system involved in multi-copper enzyme maturation permease subunit
VGSYAAELLKLRRRPAVWVIYGLWLPLTLLFTYVLPYLSYRSKPNSPHAHHLLAELLASNLPVQGLSGYAVWGGALIVVLGALSLGSEYGWGTVKTMLTVRSGRLSVLLSQIGALFTSLAGLVIASFVCSSVASLVVAATVHVTTAAPSATELVRSMATGWLILCMWCAFGAVLAILMRGTAMPIGLALVWILVVENVIRATAPGMPVLAALERGLPGVNAGSLVAAMGQRGSTATTGDGVAAIVGGGEALAVVALYLLLFVSVGALVMRTRDVL